MYCSKVIELTIYLRHPSKHPQRRIDVLARFVGDATIEIVLSTVPTYLPSSLSLSRHLLPLQRPTKTSRHQPRSRRQSLQPSPSRTSPVLGSLSPHPTTHLDKLQHLHSHLSLHKRSNRRPRLSDRTRELPPASITHVPTVNRFALPPPAAAKVPPDIPSSTKPDSTRPSLRP